MTKKIPVKKIVVIAMVIVAIAIVAFALYYIMAPSNTDSENGTGDGIKDFLPFGRFDNTSPINSGQGGDQGGENTGFVVKEPDEILGLSSLRQLSDKPVSGASFFEANGEIFVRFVERETGHIFNAYTTSTEITRVSNTTIPGIQEALWVDASTVLLRYLSGETIETFLAEILPQDTNIVSTSTTSDGEGETVGTFLTPNISFVAVSPVSTKFFSLLTGASGSLGTIHDRAGQERTTIFSSPLNDWLVQWPSSETLALSSKPSFGEEGELFYLNSETGTLTNVLTGHRGLTALVSPDTQNILYSESSKRSMSLSNKNLEDETTTKLIITTLPEKCVWSKADTATVYCAVPANGIPSEMPDTWYKGEVSFSDNIWKIDLNTGSSQLVTNPLDMNIIIDGTNLSLDSQEDYLLFTNKHDLSLWLLELP